jgi:hypothetical protein
LFSLPPTTTVGSNSACVRIVATSDVVVVFPWVPPIAMPNLIRISSASISARRITGIFAARAATTSALSGRTAEDTTTTSTPSTFSATWPVRMSPPSAARRFVVSEALRSEPRTPNPRFNSTSAMPLMPMPPMPTKWTMRVRFSMPNPTALPVTAASAR